MIEVQMAGRPEKTLRMLIKAGMDEFPIGWLSYSEYLSESVRLRMAGIDLIDKGDTYEFRFRGSEGAWL